MGMPRHREGNLYCPTVSEEDFFSKVERKSVGFLIFVIFPLFC
jgi:hypothetical protein